jgi:hypothetical protein
MNHEEKIGPSLVVTYLIKTLKIIYSETCNSQEHLSRAMTKPT